MTARWIPGKCKCGNIVTTVKVGEADNVARQGGTLTGLGSLSSFLETRRATGNANDRLPRYLHTCNVPLKLAGARGQHRSTPGYLITAHNLGSEHSESSERSGPYSLEGLASARALCGEKLSAVVGAACGQHGFFLCLGSVRKKKKKTS